MDEDFASYVDQQLLNMDPESRLVIEKKNNDLFDLWLAKYMDCGN